MFYALFVCGLYFYNTGLYKVRILYLLFWGTSFLSFSVLCVFCVMNFEFDVIFTELQHINTVFVSVIWPSVILLSLDENFLFAKTI